jgi:hypothetical protein
MTSKEARARLARASPSFRYAVGAGAFVPLVMLALYAYKRFTTPAVDADEIMRGECGPLETANVTRR